MSENTFRQTFAVSGPARLSLRNIRGKMTVRPADDGQVTVTAVKYLDDGDPDRTSVEMWQSGEGHVFVATRYQREWPGKPCRVDYEVRLPAPCTLALRGVTGGVLLQGLDGTFRVKMVSGAVRLQELEGSLWVSSVSGDVTAVQLGGRLRIDTVSGSVQVQAARLDVVEASTVNGDLTMETSLAGGPYHFKTVSGDLRLVVPPETNCRVEMQSVSGRLVMDGVARKAGPLTGRQEATLGEGGTLVRFQSISGDCAVGQPVAAGEAAS